MALRLVAFLVCAALSLGIQAVDLYTADWKAPQFIAMSGVMVIPNLPNLDRGGTAYVWPGLQSDNGALQAVLDGSGGNWRISARFNGSTPSLPSGDGFNVSPGDKVHFSFNSSGTDWNTTLSSNGKSVSTSFAIPGSTMNRATFAVEVGDVYFNFGPIEYWNVSITATTPARSAGSGGPSGWSGNVSYRGYYPRVWLVQEVLGNSCTFLEILQGNAFDVPYRR